jgi:hypothetical protein
LKGNFTSLGGGNEELCVLKEVDYPAISYYRPVGLYGGFNLLAPEFYILILAHHVCKM